MKSTQREEFDAMPGLITRKQFLQLTGLSKNDLPGMIAGGEIKVWRRQGHTKGRYYKSDAAKFLNFTQ